MAIETPKIERGIELKRQHRQPPAISVADIMMSFAERTLLMFVSI